MGIKIIKDNLHEKECEWNLVGKEYFNYQGGQFRWRLMDDDGEIHLYFLSDADPSEVYEEEGFAPLDYFQPLYGCTEIQYRENGEYKTL